MKEKFDWIKKIYNTLMDKLIEIQSKASAL